MGVELGQVAIVAMFLPLAFMVRRSGIYRKVIVRAGSALIALVALLWLAERLFDIRLIT